MAAPPPPRRTLVAVAAAAVLLLAGQAVGAGRKPAPPDPAAMGLRTAIRWLDGTVSTSGAYGYTWAPGAPRASQFGATEPTAELCLAFLHVDEATGGDGALAAARRIAAFAARTQLGTTGGWWQDMYTASSPQQPGGRLFYRTDAEAGRKSPADEDITVYRSDTEQTTGLLKCLMRLDRAESRTDRQLEHVVDYGLHGLLAAAYQPSGGYADWYLTCGADATGLYPAIRCHNAFPVLPATVANVPDRFPAADATCSDPQAGVPARVQYYSLDDATSNDILDTLFEAWRWSGQAPYRRAAGKLADWLVRAQLPAPQSGWSLYYDEAMHPVWGRGYEPAALNSVATFATIRSLLAAYATTGARAYLEAAVRGYRFIWSHRLAGGLWPVWIQLGTNRPLYVSDGSHGSVPRCGVTTDPSYAHDWPAYGQLVSEDYGSLPGQVRAAGHGRLCPSAPAGKRTLALARRRATVALRQLAAQEQTTDASPVSLLAVADELNTVAQYVGLRDHRPVWLDPVGIHGTTTVRESPCVYVRPGTER